MRIRPGPPAGPAPPSPPDSQTPGPRPPRTFTAVLGDRPVGAAPAAAAPPVAPPPHAPASPQPPAATGARPGPVRAVLEKTLDGERRVDALLA
ncbi:MAG TPA: hypothetical protein VIF57_12565, partial [Polyangia bacterium]